MPKYSQDPIVEAVLGISFDGLDPGEIAEVRTTMSSVLKEYKVLRELPGDEEEPKEDASSELRQSEYGGFALEMGNKSVHIRPDEFSFHWQKPYISWEVFFPEAIRCWDIFFGKYPQLKLDSLFVRYVNSILVPVGEDGKVEFEKFFYNTPVVPRMNGSKLEQFTNHSLIDFKERGIHVIITQTTLDAKKSGTPFILDINVHNHAETANSDVKSLFNEFRIIKNDVFEQLISEDCRRLIR